MQKDRIYQVDVTVADEPEMNQQIVGNINSISGSVPMYFINVLKFTAEKDHDKFVSIDFVNGLTRIVVKTINGAIG